jgi:hypothetical protein
VSKRQCLAHERNLMSLAGQGQMSFELQDGKLHDGEFCDSVTSGPDAWPVRDGSPTPPAPGPAPPACANPPDPNERCIPS